MKRQAKPVYNITPKYQDLEARSSGRNPDRRGSQKPYPGRSFILCEKRYLYNCLRPGKDLVVPHRHAGGESLRKGNFHYVVGSSRLTHRA